jgi:hypothetical protein
MLDLLMSESTEFNSIQYVIIMSRNYIPCFSLVFTWRLKKRVE